MKCFYKSFKQSTIFISFFHTFFIATLLITIKNAYNKTDLLVKIKNKRLLTRKNLETFYFYILTLILNNYKYLINNVKM